MIVPSKISSLSADELWAVIEPPPTMSVGHLMVGTGASPCLIAAVRVGGGF